MHTKARLTVRVKPASWPRRVFRLRYPLARTAAGPIDAIKSQPTCTPRHRPAMPSRITLSD